MFHDCLLLSKRRLLWISLPSEYIMTINNIIFLGEMFCILFLLQQNRIISEQFLLRKTTTHYVVLYSNVCSCTLQLYHTSILFSDQSDYTPYSLQYASGIIPTYKAWHNKKPCNTLHTDPTSATLQWILNMNHLWHNSIHTRSILLMYMCNCCNQYSQWTLIYDH